MMKKFLRKKCVDVINAESGQKDDAQIAQYPHPKRGYGLGIDILLRYQSEVDDRDHRSNEEGDDGGHIDQDTEIVRAFERPDEHEGAQNQKQYGTCIGIGRSPARTTFMCRIE